MVALKKPTQADLLAAVNQTIPDIIAPHLQILFCGINPGLYSGYTGHHFARPGNRFWPTLYAAGFTERQLKPAEQTTLPARGYGITNLVERATATAAELTPAELLAGGQRLRAKIEHYQPAMVAVLGVTAYRAAFQQPKAQMGEQPTGIGPARLWILPNPSGLNAHYTLADLARVFRELRLSVESRAA
ncbi:MAG: G/U mismatch-specific DNA glycosylase [Caldilineaceae bacterium]|nr:G/U mismatch-specific DNA glycosylase [Caldilineaceae bacterium]